MHPMRRCFVLVLLVAAACGSDGGGSNNGGSGNSRELDDLARSACRSVFLTDDEQLFSEAILESAIELFDVSETDNTELDDLIDRARDAHDRDALRRAAKNLASFCREQGVRPVPAT
jgi:hypothetical protein